MPSAEIISIGTEILLGDILDTNAQKIAQALRAAGVDLYRKTTVGDNPQRIAQVVREGMQRAEILITTGGLGPTVDDPTREAVALALGVEVEYRPELWEQIQQRFQRYGRLATENNKRQAYIPQGAIAIENPVGTAPAFAVLLQRNERKQAIISLPGVPSEMETLLSQAVIPLLHQEFDLHNLIKTRVLHTAGVGESQIDEKIADLELLTNPTVGLAAHSGQVDVRLTVKAASPEVADHLLADLEAEVRSRLGKWVYGVDQETLEAAAYQALERLGWSLAVLEAGLGGELVRRLAALPGAYKGGEVLASLPDPETLPALLDQFRQARGADTGLGVMVKRREDRSDIWIILSTPAGQTQASRSYGGPPEYAPRWAASHSLDLLRKLEKNTNE